MTRDIASLAQVFIEATRATCVDADTVTQGLAAVFAAVAPQAKNELKKRRLAWKAQPFFARYQRETGVSRDDICAPSTGGKHRPDPLTPRRDAFVAMLLESAEPTFSVYQAAAIVCRNREAVRKTYARHKGRMATAAVEKGKVFRFASDIDSDAALAAEPSPYLGREAIGTAGRDEVRVAARKEKAR